ncbi:MAG: RNA 2',3'-cyclic phosphodiesterase [Bacteroidales bacterium]|nr:RNA 2',3'-cyclic phosphodiesterase [Bacteroidales bacterium]MDD4210614.1 RNA 2',3'-cyclic phosphodiesterase [Bacteroidales bacterium]
MKHLFIAIQIPFDNEFIAACQRLHQSSNKLDKINWIKPENMHITLKFLGETTPDLISSIENSIEKLTNCIAPFKITLNRIGAFGSRYHPRIIWLGSDDIITEINMLHKELEKSMRAFGFKPSFGNFVPHATLARIHNIDDKKFFWNEIEKKTSLFSFTFQVNEIVLFESILTNAFTPLYKKQKIFYLKIKK